MLECGSNAEAQNSSIVEDLVIYYLSDFLSKYLIS